MCEHAWKKIHLEPGAEKRQRTRTPPEEPEADDEWRFVEEEERAAKGLQMRIRIIGHTVVVRGGRRVGEGVSYRVVIIFKGNNGTRYGFV